MTEYYDPNNDTGGACGAALELRRLHRAAVALIATPMDTPDEIENKRARLERGLTELTRQALDALSARGTNTRIGIYVRPAASMDDTRRVAVQLGGSLYRIALSPDVDPRGLITGQLVELSPDGAMVVHADPVPPHAGEVKTVTKVLWQGRERWLEVEDSAGDHRTRVRTSGFLDHTAIFDGDGVRVLDGFVYERVENHIKRKSFLDSMVWDPDDSVQFDKVKGQAAAVRETRTFIHRALEPHRFPRSMSLNVPVAFLNGPPGMGKTYIAAAAANLARELAARQNAPIETYLVPGGAVKNQFVGNSEANLMALFQKPAEGYRLVVLDEFDAVGVQRGTWDGSGVGHSMVSTLLGCLGGKQRLDGLILIFITNFPELIDEALLRPGRLGGLARIEVGALSAGAMRDIVRSELVGLAAECPELMRGSSVDALLAGADAALDQVYGSAIVGKETVDIRGRHLCSGAAGSDGLQAAIHMIHQHMVTMDGQLTPFDVLTPAHMYNGMRRTLRSVLETYAGPANLRRARAFFSNTLVHPDETKSLNDVVAFASERVETPAEYDLAAMRELEEARHVAEVA